MHSMMTRVIRPARRALRAARRLLFRAVLFVVGRDRSGPAPELKGNEKVYILIAHGYGMGGTIRTVFNTAEWLSRRHEVEIVSALRTRDTTRIPLPNGVRITALDDARKGHELTGVNRWLRTILSRVPSLFADHSRAYSKWNLWTDLVLFRWLRSLEGGVLITTRPRWNVLAGRVVRRSVFLIGQEHMHAAAYGPRYLALIKREYQHLDVFTVLTDEDKKVYEGIFCEKPVNVVRMPNAARPSGRNVAIDARRTTIVAAGRLAKIKGFDLLIEAWKQIEDAWPEWTVEVYGRGGTERAALETMIAENDLAGRVQLMGEVRDLATVFENAGMFVLSSRMEGLPMVLLEAMAAGCPVVSFDCPRGPSEIVHTGIDGILVPAEDVPKLAAAMQQMLEDPQLRETYSAAGMESARAYSMDAVGARWDALLSPRQRAG